jgi:hypothetical protein
MPRHPAAFMTLPLALQLSARWPPAPRSGLYRFFLTFFPFGAISIACLCCAVYTTANGVMLVRPCGNREPRQDVPVHDVNPFPRSRLLLPMSNALALYCSP